MIEKRIPWALALLILTATACVRGQDASEVADLVLVEAQRSPSLNGDGSSSGPTTQGAVFAVVDNMDGTITAEAQNLLWAKCSQVDAAGDNMYNSTLNDCSKAPGGSFAYCSVADDSCNGGSSPGVLDGGGTSDVHKTCLDLNLGDRTDWRVPTKEELVAFYFEIHQKNTGLFETTPPAGNYWTANSSSVSSAFQLQTLTGLLSGLGPKTSTYAVRCVHDSP